MVDSEAYVSWKHWDEDGSFGVLTSGDIQYFDREFRKVAADRTPLRVLEVGFGNGTFLAYGRSRGWNMVGTELSPEQLAAGSAAGFTVFAADRLSDIEDGAYDLVVGFDVLEHIPENDSAQFLTQLRQKLTVGGRMLLRFPNVDSWLGNHLQFGDPTHVTALGYHKVTYFAAAAGLRIAAFRAPARRGFATSFVHGLHGVVAAPIVGATAAITKALYLPGSPIVLTASNVVCVLEADA